MNYKPTVLFCLICVCFGAQSAFAQINDATTPLHLLKPNYPTPYEAPEIAEVKEVLDRVYTFLDDSTPAAIISTKDSSAIKKLRTWMKILLLLRPLSVLPVTSGE